MLFNSLHFIVFCLLIIPIFFVLNNRKQKILLLFSSFYFYSCLKVEFLPLLLVSFIATFWTSILIHESKELLYKKLWLFLCLFVNLVILVFFKYTDFLRSIYYDLMYLFGLNYSSSFVHYNFILPLGISFYTFQAIAYAIDVYRGQIPAEKSFFKFSLFLIFFPQLVAGPIIRASVLIPQFDTKKYFHKENLLAGLSLVAMGMFKKTLIADPISDLITPVYANPNEYNSIALVIAYFLFSVQIYCDFAGYSDIAIGIARVMGYEIPANFIRPYFAKSPADVWKRWHISLSSWLRDYVFFPLGGSRCSQNRIYINLFATMIIGGIWHGAAWTFVLWGSIHAFALVIEKILDDRNYLTPFTKLPLLVKVLLTFNLFAFGAFFFRSLSIESSLVHLKKMFLFQSGKDIGLTYSIFILVLVLFIIEFVEEYKLQDKFSFAYSKEIKYIITFTVIILSTMIYTVTSSPQFYYFQF